MFETISTVIFDLDGVICFSDKYHYQAWKSLADQLGIYFDEQINHRLRGVSRIDSLDIILKQANRRFTEKEKQILAEEKNALYRKLLMKMGPDDISKDAQNTLVELRRRGYKLAIGSSSKNTPLILDRLGIQSFFDAVADGNEILHSKPNPEVFLLAAKKLQVKPENCVVVEDAKAGIVAAKAAGMSAVSLYGDARNCNLEDYNLDTLQNLLQILPKSVR